MSERQTLTRRVAMLLRPFTDHMVYTVRSGVAAGLKRRGGLGFMKRTPSIEEDFVRQLDLRGKVVYEVGSYEGIYTIYFASQASRVIVFEPHPVSQQRTLTNIDLNGFSGKVSLHRFALGSSAGDAVMVYPKAEPARASIEPAVSSKIEHEESHFARVQVKIETMDALANAHQLPAPDFIKIDAEGAEYDILLGAKEVLRRYRPQLLIEIHGAGGDAKANARRIAALLEEVGYALTHVEDGSRVDSQTAPGNLGHIYAQAVSVRAGG